MKWLPDVIERLLGREPAKPELERADQVLERVDSIRIIVRPKNRRALDELRRLAEGHVRR